VKLISLNAASNINCRVAHVKDACYMAAAFAFKKSYLVLALKGTHFNEKKKKPNKTNPKQRNAAPYTQKQEILFFLTVF